MAPSNSIVSLKNEIQVHFFGKLVNSVSQVSPCFKNGYQSLVVRDLF